MLVSVGACLIMTWYTYVVMRRVCGSWVIWVLVVVELGCDGLGMREVKFCAVRGVCACI